MGFTHLVLNAADIQTEKTHQSIFEGVTAYDKASLRHTETHEKVALPDKEGRNLVGFAIKKINLNNMGLKMVKKLYIILY